MDIDFWKGDVKVLDDATAVEIVDSVKSICNDEGVLGVIVSSFWGGSQRWGRNSASLTSDQRDTQLFIYRSIRGAKIVGRTNQLDSESVQGLCNLLEYYGNKWSRNLRSDMMLDALLPQRIPPGISVWDEKAMERTAQDNGVMLPEIVRSTMREGLLSAGFFETRGMTKVSFHRDDYGRETIKSGRSTQAQCSLTVRHPKGIGSGWAGTSSFHMQSLDPYTLAKKALDKCMKSIDPVRIEPGRYNVVLEPQATYSFVDTLVEAFNRLEIEASTRHPLSLGRDGNLNRIRSKLGLKIVDDRITISHDPSDPEVGTMPDDFVEEVILVQDGVLKSLWNTAGHELNELSRFRPNIYRPSIRVKGYNKSIDSLVESMERGLLVTRVDKVQKVDNDSLLCTGLTRDGLWLIEEGRITKAVKNFRWTESPMFIFNNILDISEGQQVFFPIRQRFFSDFRSASQSAVVPAISVKDFSFTSTIDAI